MAVEKKRQDKNNRAANDAEFSGRIESVIAGGDFRFAVTAKKGGRRMFSVNAADAAHFSAMTALVTSSYLAGKKVNVSGTVNGGVVYTANEIRIGAKPKPVKVKAVKPKKPVAEAPPPAVGSAA
jgi:hypothetical protein